MALTPARKKAARKKVVRQTRAKSDATIAASPAVRREWGRRVEAEYRSAAIAHHLTLWLIQMGASPDLIDAGLRIVKDELVHAELSHDTFVAAGGKSLPAIERETLRAEHDPEAPLELSVLRVCLDMFCLGETVAVPLFKVLREECVVPTARKALDRVLRDEVRHRDFGWTLLEYLLEQPAADEMRRATERELPTFFARIRRSYAPPGAAGQKQIPSADRAWGLMPLARYGQILERTMERDYRPRFAELGFDATPAWDAAQGATA